MSLFWIGCFVILGLISISGLIMLLLKIGVVVQKAGEAPHIDHGHYSMDQGREVKAEDQ
ncbi:hypothetical protein [Herpetosiphon geysericola]|uniref:hypothetical protein n=1 Tax=Herpetosiphon geysericola TaxID=70996 RepID=UPI001476F974|nr:hypothetical protein [Herpetosiphon geysericola]